MPPRFFARQLSRPAGFFGRIVGRLMNRYNARMNAFAVRQLDLNPSDRDLEVGFGGGVTLPSLIKTAAFVAGADLSPLMVGRARARFSKAVATGRADFREGAVEALPFEAGSFSKACTSNTIYFWRSLDAGCTELYRVLSPGGRLVIGFLPKERMDQMSFPDDIFTARAPEEVLAALAKAGFIEARVTRPEDKTPWNVIVAMHP